VAILPLSSRDTPPLLIKGGGTLLSRSRDLPPSHEERGHPTPSLEGTPEAGPFVNKPGRCKHNL